MERRRPVSGERRVRVSACPRSYLLWLISGRSRRLELAGETRRDVRALPWECMKIDSRLPGAQHNRGPFQTTPRAHAFRDVKDVRRASIRKQVLAAANACRSQLRWGEVPRRAPMSYPRRPHCDPPPAGKLACIGAAQGPLSGLLPPPCCIVSPPSPRSLDASGTGFHERVRSSLFFSFLLPSVRSLPHRWRRKSATQLLWN